MKLEEASKLKNGVYKIYLKSGGWVVGSIGKLDDGCPWFAPSNWAEESVSTVWLWSLVEKVEAIKLHEEIRMKINRDGSIVCEDEEDEFLNSIKEAQNDMKELHKNFIDFDKNTVLVEMGDYFYHPEDLEIERIDRNEYKISGINRMKISSDGTTASIIKEKVIFISSELRFFEHYEYPDWYLNWKEQKDD